MSDRSDPVDNWLGTDVELMPAPPGSFGRIHRRARRRKATVAMSAAAAAAIVIAGAAALPQLAASLLPGHGNPARVQQPSSSGHARTQPGSRRPKTPKPRNSPASVKTPATGLAITGSAYPAAAGFAPTSVTFVGADVGAVIGYTSSSCPGSACTVVAGTSDYGQSWSRADAPPAGPPDGGTGVSQIRFLDDSDGWAFGPALYATHDGGASWAQISELPGRVIDLSTVDGTAFAVVARCSGGGAAYASGCTSFSLYSSPYNADNWQRVPGAAGQLAVTPGGLQFTSQYGYLLAGHVLFSGSPSGGAWQQRQLGSGTVPACLNGHSRQAAAGETGLIAPGTSSQLYLVCQGTPSTSGSPVLYYSADAGQTWRLAGRVAASGADTSLAVVPAGGSDGGALILATSSGIYYSVNTRSWHRASVAGQAPPSGFRFVGMTTNQNGVAVPAQSALRKIYITRDGGLHWQATTI